MEVTSDGKAESTHCPHHIPTTRTHPFLPSTSTSSAHSQLFIGKPWGINCHPHSPLLQATPDRWAGARSLRAAAPHWFLTAPVLPREYFTPPTPESTLSSRAAMSKFSVQAALLSFKENLEIKAAVRSGRQPSLFALERRWPHIVKDKMSRELRRKYIHPCISSSPYLHYCWQD